MKKLLCLCLTIAICASATGCGKETSTRSEIKYPFEEVSAVYDVHGQLLQQTLLNKETGDLLLKEFMYESIDGIWTCISQHTTVLSNTDSKPQNDNSILNIYFNNDLADGPITIMDNEWAKVSIVKFLAADDWWEFGYELKVINKTNDLLSILIDGCSIMEINCKPMFTIDHIDAGDTAYFTLAWDKETLERCYIPYIDNIEFMVRVFDNDDWTVPALAGTRIMLKK